MDSFVAIDFETANAQRCSICSVGLVVVKDGEIVDRIYRLIRPEPEEYSYWNVQVPRRAGETTSRNSAK